MSFIKNMGKNTDHTKQSATDTLKNVRKNVIHKTTEAAGDLIVNKITDIITKVSRASPQI